MEENVLLLFYDIFEQDFVREEVWTSLLRSFVEWKPHINSVAKTYKKDPARWKRYAVKAAALRTKYYAHFWRKKAAKILDLKTKFEKKRELLMQS